MMCIDVYCININLICLDLHMGISINGGTQ